MTIIQLANPRARATAAALNPVKYDSPANPEESAHVVAAMYYVCSYYDTCRENGVTPVTVPDHFHFAWLEYKRRATHAMGLREGFRYWREHGTLPGLD